jgi:hypothetical protein
VLGGIPKFSRSAGADETAKWRTFEVITRVEVTDPVRRACVVAGAAHEQYGLFQKGTRHLTGNFKAARSIQYDKYGTGLVFANGSRERAPRFWS